MRNNLSSTDSYEKSDYYKCHKYIGNNIEEIKEKAINLYYYPLQGDLIFNDDNSMYVCLKKTCNNIEKIDDFYINDDDKEHLMVVFVANSGTFSTEIYNLEGNHLKLSAPVIPCN